MPVVTSRLLEGRVPAVNDHKMLINCTAFDKIQAPILSLDILEQRSSKELFSKTILPYAFVL